MADYHTQKNRQSIRIPEYDYSQLGAYFVTLVTHERECLFGEIIAGRMELSPLGRIAEEQWLRLPGRFPNWATDAFQIMPNHTHGVLNKRVTLSVGAVGAQRSFTSAGSDSATLRPASNIKGSTLPGSAPMGKHAAPNGPLRTGIAPPNNPDASDRLAPGAASPDRPCVPDGSLRPYSANAPKSHNRLYQPDYNAHPDRRNVDADSLGAVVRAYKSAVAFRFQQMLGTPGLPLWQRNYYEHIVRDEDDLDRIRLYIRENPLRWPEDEDNIFSSQLASG